MSADNVFFKDAVVVTTLKRVGDVLVLDLPFDIYSQVIVMDGAVVTYRLNDLSLEGREVMANIHYSIADKKAGEIVSQKNDSSAVLAYSGKLENPLQDTKYNKHFPYLTKDNKPAPFCVSDAIK